MASILVIEDNPANMKLACLLLRKANHTVLCAVDAETGLTLARADQPDLILMDIQLPGMDGLEATALLKQDSATAAIPVIALTAMAMKEDQEKTKVAGCDAYIAKPLRYQELYAAIDTLLANKPAGGERRSSLSTGALTIPNATILIIDDQIQNRTLLETLLRPEGYLTLSAASGEEALASIAQHAPDLILLDVMMPGMDGYQVAGIPSPRTFRSSW
jgi:two-component system cell cycle response regulator DivK